MKSKRIISFLLLASMLCTLFVSCKSEDEKDSSDTSDTSETIAEVNLETEEETEANYLESLPTVNYDGAEFTILCRDEKAYEIWAEAETGETINDAVFRRNKAVEEKYSVTIRANEQVGGWNDKDSFMNLIRKSVRGQDGAYDLVAGYMAYTSNLVIEGMFANLNDIDTIDLSNVWWTKGFVENNTIQGCTYLAMGDISLTMWEGIYAIYFNKQLAENYNCGDLYQLVKDGKWTLETFEELAKAVSDDLDGDSKYTNADRYGYVTNRHSLRAFVTTSDIPIASSNDEGTFDLVYYGDRVVSLYENLYSFLNDGHSVFFSKPTAGDWDYTEMMNMFLENRALFISGTLDNTTMLRQMDTDFGILPFPKYDENQSSYLSHSYDGLSIFAIPVAVNNIDMSGSILEALCAESSQTVIPEFYETVLKGKVTRDNDSEEMIDLLRENLLFDFGFVHSVPIGNIFAFFGDELQNKSSNYASKYEAKRSSFEKQFEKLLESYTKITE